MGIHFFANNFGISIGNANTKVIQNGKIIYNEPSLVAIDVHTKKLIGIGNDALNMVGKEAEDILVLSPVEDSVIADFELAEEMVREILRKSSGVSLIPSKVVATIPVRVTEIEKNAMEEAILAAGAREVLLIESSEAAYYGFKNQLKDSTNVFLVDIGDGTTEVSVLFQGKIIASKISKVAGQRVDDFIQDLLETEYEMLISKDTAETIKRTLASFVKRSQNESLTVRGKDIYTGLPKVVEVSSENVRLAVEKVLPDIIDTIKEVIEQTSPEIIADIFDEGIILIGGLSNIPGLASVISNILHFPVQNIKNPENVGIQGLDVVLKNYRKFKKSKN